MVLQLTLISVYTGCSVGLIASIHISIQRLCSGLYLIGIDIYMEKLCNLAGTHMSIHRGRALVLWPAVAPIHRCCAVGLTTSCVIYTQHRVCEVILWLALMSVYRKCVIGLVASSSTYTEAVHLVLLLTLIKSSHIVFPCWNFKIVTFSVVSLQKNYIISTTHMIFFC